MAKEKKDPYISLFENKKVDEFMEIITKEAAGDEAKERVLKVSARRALTIKNMSEYILANVDEKKLPQAKKDFKAMTYTGGTRTVKDKKTGEEREVPVQNVNKAASHFLKTYMPNLLVEEKPRENAFDAIADW